MRILKKEITKETLINDYVNKLYKKGLISSRDFSLTAADWAWIDSVGTEIIDISKKHLDSLQKRDLRNVRNELVIKELMFTVIHDHTIAFIAGMMYIGYNIQNSGLPSFYIINVLPSGETAAQYEQAFEKLGYNQNNQQMKDLFSFVLGTATECHSLVFPKHGKPKCGITDTISAMIAIGMICELKRKNKPSKEELLSIATKMNERGEISRAELLRIKRVITKD